jgi:hypothetical protein
MRETAAKEAPKLRALTLDNPPPLNPMRSVLVGVIVCVALAAAVYWAVMVG